MNLPTFYDDHTGETRVLGTLPPPPGHRLPCAAPSATLPESQWQEFELAGMPVKVKDQDGKGACNAHAAATSLEIARWIAGMDHVDLSPWFVYAILCNGIDSGSAISDALRLLTQTGTCPDALVPYGTIDPRRLPAAARSAAGRFKIRVGSPCRNFAEMMTATQLRRPGDFSLHVGANFNDLDADGCPGYSPGWGNHALTFGLGARRGKDGRWLIKGRNSWSEKWGLNGDFWFSAAHVDHEQFFDAYTVEAVTDDPEADDEPPVAS